MAGNDQKLTQDAAEHTLPTGNWPGTWRNTLCRPEINPRRCGTHSADRKLTWDAVEHSLLIGNRPGIWRNTLCWSEIDPEHGRTHSADRKSTWDPLWIQKEIKIHVTIKGLPRGSRATRGFRELISNAYNELLRVAVWTHWWSWVMILMN